MKNSILILVLIVSVLSVNAQSVKGALTLNGKSETKLKLESNSAVQLFKEFKTGKYQLKFTFDSREIPKNEYKETIVFFEFITSIKKDGKLVKNVIRKQPIPYFPGEMFIPAEAFDFIGVLASMYKQRGQGGIMPKGEYLVQLVVKPIDYKGEVRPLAFSFSAN